VSICLSVFLFFQPFSIFSFHLFHQNTESADLQEAWLHVACGCGWLNIKGFQNNSEKDFKEEKLSTKLLPFNKSKFVVHN
jgi:hypothetical protein